MLERRQCEDALKERKKRIPDGDFVSLRGVAVEGEGVGTADKCRADEFDLGVWGEAGNTSESDILKREDDRGEEGMYTSTREGGDGF